MRTKLVLVAMISIPAACFRLLLDSIVGLYQNKRMLMILKMGKVH
jgi:hypothetical protein